jgi:membrane protein DedA with SNARE-associated domain
VVYAVNKFGYTGVFTLMVMESATLPVPSEVVLPIAGYLVFLGQMNYWLALVFASVGSLTGTLIDYFIGLYVGRSVILHFGKYVRINEKQLATSERWFDKFGEITVLFARFVPLIRTLVAFPAGIAEMKVWKFVVFSLGGILIWDGALIYLGMLAGKNSSQIISVLTHYFTIFEVLAVVAAMISVIIYAEKRRNREESNERDSNTKVIPRTE